MPLLANGTRTRKVFNLKRVALTARASHEFQSKVSFAPITTRKHYPGRHSIEILVSGEGFPLGEFDVRR